MKESSSPRNVARRNFVGTIAAGALLAGFDPVTQLWITQAHATAGVNFAKLPPLDGTLEVDDATLAAYAEDYGQVVRKKPIAVLKPGSIADVQRAVRFANRVGLRVAVRGAGHAVFGQSQVSAGLVIDMTPLNAAQACKAHEITVEAGASWHKVSEATLPYQLIPPVMPDYAGLTVGGTLSIGGVSPTTWRHGAQVDNVIALDVVTGDGALIHCSGSEHRELFLTALGGQGQCAIIVRATLRLVAAPAMVRLFNLPYASLPALMRDLAMITDDGRFDGAVGIVLSRPDGQWSFMLNATQYFTYPGIAKNATPLQGLAHLADKHRFFDLTFDNYLHRLIDTNAHAIHCALTTFVPAAEGEPFVNSALQKVAPTQAGESLVVQLFAWKTARFTRPMLRIPRGEETFGVALLRSAALASGTAESMLDSNRLLFEQNRLFGGTHYPFSAVKLSRNDWKLHYSEQWQRLRDAKRRYDANNVFASGPDLFAEFD